MDSNILFIVITFIVIITVVLMSDSPLVAFLLIVMIVNLFYLIKTYNGGELTITKLLSKKPIHVTTTPSLNDTVRPEDITGDFAVDPTATDAYPENTSLYGAQHSQYVAYNDVSCYPRADEFLAYTTAEAGGVDANCALLAQRKCRERRTTDGWLTKDANYYKIHYADELRETEQKPWWGNNEV